MSVCDRYYVCFSVAFSVVLFFAFAFLWCFALWWAWLGVFFYFPHVCSQCVFVSFILNCVWRCIFFVGCVCFIIAVIFCMPAQEIIVGCLVRI